MSYTRFFPHPTETVLYQWHLSERFKYAYNATPKAATTGILRALQIAENSAYQPAPDKIHDREASPLKTIEQVDLAAEQVFAGSEIFRFTYVRNPFTRILSAYLDKMFNPYERARLAPDLGLDPDAPPAFPDFLLAVQSQRDSWRDIHWQTQDRLIQRANVHYHFIGRFETWAQSFPIIARRVGISGPIMEWTGKPVHATDATSLVDLHIGPKERDIILAIYDADFWSFGYSPDPKLASL